MEQTLTTPYLRKFGFTLSIVLIGLFGLAFPLWAESTFPAWPFIAGGILAAMALLLPSLLRFIYTPWMKLGHVLGWINTRIILGALFFIVITPMGFVMRRLGYNPMANHYDPNAATYRRVSTPRPIQHMEKPF